MKKQKILSKLTEVAHQPFLIFANQVQGKKDNAFETLLLLEKEEQVTAGRISEYLDIKPSSVTQIIKKLETNGTIERIKSEKDARVILIKLTEKGKDSILNRDTVSSGLIDELFSGFKEEEVDNLEEYLTRMIENISSEVFQSQLKEQFGNEDRWQQLGAMSTQFERAREQMLKRSKIDGFSEEMLRRGFGRNNRFWRGNEE
ncbi:MarR family winged helix-turn-helix transcriptional regulator [Vagococcus entomophilus]|uniref:MarR family transcriptional regulator n=1 Tax=Vagococcus entomophilus TaxID=1160095 RepID=A0A430AHI8_9ENTE|nr:MarR family transcriptional regulator [Vagococcus entomophilus]RSU07358.1 MarR family transcriptional regulator [Vagococcus entomophilus]